MANSLISVTLLCCLCVTMVVDVFASNDEEVKPLTALLLKRAVDPKQILESEPTETIFKGSESIYHFRSERDGAEGLFPSRSANGDDSLPEVDPVNFGRSKRHFVPIIVPLDVNEMHQANEPQA